MPFGLEMQSISAAPPRNKASPLVFLTSDVDAKPGLFLLGSGKQPSGGGAITSLLELKFSKVVTRNLFRCSDH